MSTFLGTYDPTRVRTLITPVNAVGGGTGLPIEVTGFTEGSFINVVRENELYTVKKGSTGEVSRGRNPVRSAMITMSLQHNSPMVRIFNNWIAEERDTPLCSISIVDPSSYDSIKTTIGWLHKDADHDWSEEVGDREYEFFAVDVDTPSNKAVDLALLYRQQFTSTG